ncbi:hypothetical protein PVAP13_7KG322700 [Panicum virgatum]|uniref:HMA domain-containing protein n=1 Tax=Panicum virgatum TaxID=38727 RepID=A0A8T0QL19_PANVG|nr:hypothetical protein PVAP13_7KG322700 [Panicum virgatum]
MGEEKDKKVEVKTAAYKVHVHCGQCARDIQTQFTEFQGVEEVKVDAGAGKVTVKGFGFDVEKLRAKVEKGCRKKVELVVPAKKEDVVIEVKTKEEELKVITIKVPLHCPDCALRVKEILLEHKSIYEAKTDLGKNTCTVEGTIEEKKLVEYIYQRTRKKGVVEKIEKKVIVKEEKVEVKKDDKKEVAKVVDRGRHRGEDHGGRRPLLHTLHAPAVRRLLAPGPPPRRLRRRLLLAVRGGLRRRLPVRCQRLHALGAHRIP